VSDAVNSKSAVEITDRCIVYYSEDEIKKANDLLGEFLKSKPKRRRGDDKIKMELSDIIELLIEHQKDDVFPKFVTDSINAFPPGHGYEGIAKGMLDMQEEIRKLKDEVKLNQLENRKKEELPQDIEVIKEEIVEIKKYMVELKGCLMKSGKAKSDKTLSLDIINDESFNVARNRAQPSAPPLSQYSGTHYFQASQGTREGMGNEYGDIIDTSFPLLSQNSVSPLLLGDDKSFKRESYVGIAKSLRKMKDSEMEENYEEPIMTEKRVGKYIEDSEGFKRKVKNKRFQGIVGTRTQSCGLEGVCKQTEIYVGRLEEKTTVENVTNYVTKDNKFQLLKCEQLNCIIPDCSSFKLTIKEDQLAVALSAEMWPKNVICRRFRTFRRSRTDTIGKLE
jgi:hypothetical protein